MGSLLVGDIGGTNSRFAVVGKSPTDLRKTVRFQNDVESDFETVFQKALASVEEPIDHATIAVAGPLEDGKVRLTNRGWMIDPERLAEVSNGVKVQLVNDFGALALSLPHLGGNGLETIFSGEFEGNGGHKLVLGPGTGLGVGYLIRTEDGWMSAPGEGGHVALPIENERELSLLEPLREIWKETDGKPFDRVSSERVLCGPGLVALFRALKELSGTPHKQCEPGDVLNAHRAGNPDAIEAIDLFISFLGRVAGDLALALIPRGGIYIGGGLAPAVFELAGHEKFLSQLRTKGRVSGAIDDVSVHIIHEPNAGLIGAAAAALK